MRLPRAYVELLKIKNGGRLELSLPDSVVGELLGIPTAENIGKTFVELVTTVGGVPTISTLYHHLERTMDEEPDKWKETKHVLTLDGDGHWYLCLDYRKNGPLAEPEVNHFELDVGSDSAFEVQPVQL